MLARACGLVAGALPGVIAVYVFGSRAAEQQTRGSDLDLAVLCLQPTGPETLFDLARRVEVEVDVDVDLVDLLSAPTVLKKEVVANGRAIICRDAAAMLEFEARTFSEYGRYREGIEPLLQAVRDSGQAYAQ